MITSRTVFVLGAGASMPYGLPSGEGLARMVFTKFTDPYIDLFTRDSPGSHSSDDVREFVAAFRESGLRSVDAFLEQRPSFVDLGKIIIASLLIPMEKPELLHNLNEPGHWYHLLWERIVSSDLRSFTDNELAIITLNYDRSLEEFLFRALIAVSGERPKTCAEALKSIPIIHVHGQLGPLPWQADDEHFREYSPRMSPESLAVAADSIRIVTERIDWPERFEEARKFLHQAKNAYLIGFGFLKENIRRLGLASPPWNGESTIRKATCYGLEAGEVAEATHLLGKGCWQLSGKDVKADLFFRRDIQWHEEG